MIQKHKGLEGTGRGRQRSKPDISPTQKKETQGAQALIQKSGKAQKTVSKTQGRHEGKGK